MGYKSACDDRFTSLGCNIEFAVQKLPLTLISVSSWRLKVSIGLLGSRLYPSPKCHHSGQRNVIIPTFSIQRMLSSSHQSYKVGKYRSPHIGTETEWLASTNLVVSWHRWTEDVLIRSSDSQLLCYHNGGHDGCRNRWGLGFFLIEIQGGFYCFMGF